MNMSVKTPPIEFIDLKAQRRRLGPALDAAIRDAVESGQYILGPQVAEFERKLAAFSDARHAIGTANGTDAIVLCLAALGIKAGDAVLCPAFTFAATAEAVAWVGATPVFVDVEETTFNIDPNALTSGLDTARREGLTPRAIIAVDLFGQTADYDALEAFCAAHNLTLICDAAQSFGASCRGKRAGAFGTLTTTSFFPAKPLGCYGDGGAIMTDDDALATLIRSLRSHGQGSQKYDNVRIGLNSRLDTLQAAILLEKLAIFDGEIEARQRVARRYDDGLRDLVATPQVPADCISVWAQYTIRIPGGRREAFMARMREQGVPTAIYYPKPLSQQEAYRHYPVAGNGVAVSERLAREVVALPMHPYLDEATQDRIVAAARAALVQPASAA